VRRLSLVVLKPSLVAGLVAVAVVGGDEWSKAWARRSLEGPHQVFGPWWWRLSYNSGASFSLGSHAPVVTRVGVVLALAGALVGLVKTAPGIPALGIGLVTGGGLGNVIDRLTSSTHVVTDFVSLGSFPTFNVADAGVTLGYVMMLVCVVVRRPLWRTR
jgi:signal peptidase II